MLLLLVICVLGHSVYIHSLPVQHSDSDLDKLGRVTRAVFDLIPSQKDATNRKVFVSGSPCPCPEDTSSKCILDHDLECRKTLATLPSKEVIFSAHYKRHRRNKLKKLFKKWIQQGGEHS